MTTPPQDAEPDLEEPAPISPPRWPGLTPRQAQIATLIAQGARAAAVADALGVAVKTVDSHRLSVLRKLRLRGSVALARYAIRWGYVSVELSPFEQRDVDDDDDAP